MVNSLTRHQKTRAEIRVLQAIADAAADPSLDPMVATGVLEIGQRMADRVGATLPAPTVPAAPAS